MHPLAPLLDWHARMSTPCIDVASRTYIEGIRMQLPEWVCSDALRETHIYCATFARAKLANFSQRGFLPFPDDPTGTVTFVRIEGRTYAVTAFHVVEQLQRQAADENISLEGFHVPVNSGVNIGGPFVRPPKPMFSAEVDVALCPIDPDLPPYIGKAVYELRPDAEPTFPLAYAIACGFPTGVKASRREPEGERLLLPHVVAVAEGVGSPEGDQLQFYSELAENPPISSLSGMSGGPVFWSDGNCHGLIGFVKEAMDVSVPDGGRSAGLTPRVHFICQRASYENFLSWAAYAECEVPRRREEINAQLRHSE
jgi:hypothetical protein